MQGARSKLLQLRLGVSLLQVHDGSLKMRLQPVWPSLCFPPVCGDPGRAQTQQPDGDRGSHEENPGELIFFLDSQSHFLIDRPNKTPHPGEQSIFKTRLTRGGGLFLQADFLRCACFAFTRALVPCL